MHKAQEPTEDEGQELTPEQAQEAAVAEALARLDLPNEGLEFGLLMLPYAKERDWERFYRQATKLVNDDKLSRQLEKFAADEKTHQRELQEAYEEIMGTLDLPERLEDCLSGCPRTGPVMRAGISAKEVLDLAIELEKAAQLFYEHQMAQSHDAEVVEALEYMAVLEEEHYIQLKMMRDDL